MTKEKVGLTIQKYVTANNIKIGICGLIPVGIGAWLYIQWLNTLTPIMNHFSSSIQNPPTTEQAVMTICLVCGLVLPLYPLLLWTLRGGLWLGKATRFYRDDYKTRWVYFDDVSYYIKDMSGDQRDKIKEILSSFKSKNQLRKEKLQTKSWVWRNFG